MTVGPTGGISQTDFCVCVACVLFLFSHSAKSVNGLFHSTVTFSYLQEMNFLSSQK